MEFATLEWEGMTLVELPGGKGVYSGIVGLDVDLARRLLKTNIHNRKIRPAKVAELARSFASGEWRLNGEACKFDARGIMLDGQHRCTAVEEVGHGAYPTLVIYGLERDSQQTMDQGLRRAAFEQMSLVGIDADATLAAAVRVLIRWNDGFLFRDSRNSKITNTSVVAWAQANPDGIALFRAFSTRGYRRILGCPPSVALAIAYRFHAIAPATTEEFFSGLISPVGMPEASPILALRHRLERIASTRQGLHERDLIAYFVSAWNGYRDGRSMAQVLGPRGGRWTPTTFPVPK